MSRSLSPLYLSLLFAVAAPVALAQAGAGLRAGPPPELGANTTPILDKAKWIPNDNAKERPDAGLAAGYSVAQQKTVYANMARVIDALVRTPVMQEPGFEVQALGAICSNGSCRRGEPVAASSGLIVRQFVMSKSGKLDVNGEGPTVSVHFNRIDRLFGSPAPKDGFFVEPAVIDTIDGFPVYEDGLMVITARKEPLFAPVTRALVLERSIKEKEILLASAVTDAAKGSPLQQFLATRDQMQKAMLAGVAMLEKSDPVKAAKTRQDIEKGTAQRERAARDADARYLADQEKFLGKLRSDLAAEQAKLAALSPAEREQGATAANGKRLVVANAAFYDKSRPVTALQVAIIDIYRKAFFGAKKLTREQMRVRQLGETLVPAKLLAAMQ
ncbi:MAG TPA: hypothetical protein VIT92_01910 [Burkholderiaceae bacterium]